MDGPPDMWLLQVVPIVPLHDVRRVLGQVVDAGDPQDVLDVLQQGLPDDVGPGGGSF